MNEEKLASNEVPEKFSEWLLAMGCPPENVPSVDKISEMCRGQYYMVWRSLMERVEAKDVVRNKKLQVFCDDMQKIQKKNVLESDTNTIAPEELLLWTRHTQLKEKVADAEARVSSEKENLQQLTECATSKLSQRNLLHKTLEETQRRAYFLQRLAEQLEEKKANLVETRSIADSLCGCTEEADIESKLNKCISSLTRTGTKLSTSLSTTANPVACSTATSNTSDHNDDEVLSSVARCRGEVLFKMLYEQRTSLCSLIPATRTDTSAQCTGKVQSVLCQTAALQSFVSLETIKNRVHVEKTREKLAAAFIGINSYLSPEECELLLTLCERACLEARVASLHSCKQEVSSRSGAFSAGAQPGDNASSDMTSLHAIDKAIESKRDELRKLITSVAAVERKTQNAKERLLVLFNGFHDNSIQGDRFTGRCSFPNESIATLRHFYEERRERHRNRVELSMNLDISDNCSFTGEHDGTPTFVNELKLYINKFHLEKNRTLVLECGEKKWIFETIASSLRYLQTKWQTEDIVTTLLYPSLTLKKNLLRILQDIARKEEMETMVQALEEWKMEEWKMDERDINITPALEEEQSTLDKIKKRLNENILNLQKTSKTLDVGLENLQFWADNTMKKYISDSRKINGVSFSCYEKAYLDSVM